MLMKCCHGSSQQQAHLAYATCCSSTPLIHSLSAPGLSWSGLCFAEYRIFNCGLYSCSQLLAHALFTCPDALMPQACYDGVPGRPCRYDGVPADRPHLPCCSPRPCQHPNAPSLHQRKQQQQRRQARAAPRG